MVLRAPVTLSFVRNSPDVELHDDDAPCRLEFAIDLELGEPRMVDRAEEVPDIRIDM